MVIFCLIRGNARKKRQFFSKFKMMEKTFHSINVLLSKFSVSRSLGSDAIKISVILFLLLERRRVYISDVQINIAPFRVEF